MERHPKLDGTGHRQYQYGADRRLRTWSKSPVLINISALAWPGKGFLLFTGLMVCTYSGEFSSLAPCTTLCSQLLSPSSPDSSGVHQIKWTLHRGAYPRTASPTDIEARLWLPSQARSAWPWPPLPSHNSEGGTIHVWIEHVSTSFNSAVLKKGIS